MSWALVALGGAVGAACRYLADIAVTCAAGRPAAVGHAAVNLLGSAAFGLLTGVAASTPDDLGALLGVGFCGAFTTASALAWETLALAERGGRRVPWPTWDSASWAAWRWPRPGSRSGCPSLPEKAIVEREAGSTTSDSDGGGAGDPGSGSDPGSTAGPGDEGTTGPGTGTDPSGEPTTGETSDPGSQTTTEPAGESTAGAMPESTTAP